MTSGAKMFVRAPVDRKRGRADTMLLALRPEQRHEYLHKIQVAASYRAWADKQEKEAKAILAGTQWWCSPTPGDYCQGSAGARQEVDLADVNTEWPSTNNSVYHKANTVQVTMKVAKPSLGRTVVFVPKKRRRRASLKTTQ